MLGAPILFVWLSRNYARKQKGCGVPVAIEVLRRVEVVENVGFVRE